MVSMFMDLRIFAQSAGPTETYHAGDIIFHQDDPAESMWIVLSGSIEIEAHNKIIEYVGPWYAIGLVSLIDDLPRSATARAHEECRLVRIDVKRFRFFVEERPNFAWFVMQQLADRLRSTNAAL
jgi:CRP-like cAMP-binding protein